MKKAKLPQRSVIFEAWKPVLDATLMIDWGEPCCWACNKSISFRESDSVHARWDNAEGLERHHIVAESLGGSAEPSNLFLLCRRCHDRAPTTTDKDILIRWAVKQSYWGDMANECNRALETFLPEGTTVEQIAEWANAKSSADFQGIFRSDEIGLHFGDRGAYIPVSGFVAKLVKRTSKRT